MVRGVNDLMENRRIKNAEALRKHGINFKSKLEVMCYEVLKAEGFKPKYEKEKFVIWEGMRPSVPFYKTGSVKTLLLDSKKLMNITYTPDFTFKCKGVNVVIEAKGYPNDTYIIKRKLFRGWLERQKEPYIFFEVHSKRSLEQAIAVIKAMRIDGNLGKKDKTKEK